MKNILVSLLVLFSTILSAAPQSKSGQVGFYQATGVAGTNRFLWDRTNDWLLLTHGALVFGTNQPLVATEIIRAVADTTAGDPSARTVTIEANNSGAGTYGGALLNVNTAGDASWTLYNHLGSGFGLEFNINAPDGVTPFALDATVAHTSGSLFSVSNLNVGKFDVAHDGMIWSATNKFAFATTTNVWPLTNAVAGQVLTSAGGASAQLYWSTASGGSGPSFADLVWTNNADVIETLAYTTNLFFRPGATNGQVPFYFNATNLLSDDLSPLMTFAYQGTNVFQFTADSVLLIGKNVFDFGPGSNSSIMSSRSSLKGENQNNNLTITAISDENYDYSGEVTIRTKAVGNFPIAEIVGASFGTNSVGGEFGMIGTANSQRIYLNDSTGAARVDLQPSVADGAPAHTLDTQVAHTTGIIARIRNLGVTHFHIASTNGIATPAITAYGAVSMPWQFGAASNTVNVQLTATNVLEVVVNGVSYLVPASLK